jgi:glycosyltransferase involved in cell wall biosynthesis
MILVLEVEPSSQRGGQELAVRDVLVEMASNGHAIVLGYIESGDLLADYQRAGIETLRLPGPFAIRHPAREWRSFVATASRLRRLEPRYVYVNQLRDVPVVAAAGLGRRARVVCHLHVQPPRVRRISQTRLSMRVVDHFIVQSRASQDAWREWGIGANRLHLVPNGYDIARYRFSPTPFVAGQPLRMGFIGRIVPQKGLHVLLEATSELLGNGRSVVLEIAGGNFPPGQRGYRAEMEKRAAAPPLAGRVEFLGHVEDAIGFYHSIDVCVFPSLHGESAPRVLVESILCGTPVIAHDLAAVHDMLGPAAAAWVYGSTEELVARLEAFAQGMPYPLLEIRQFMIDRFQLDGVVQRIEKILLDVPDGRTGNGPPRAR